METHHPFQYIFGSQKIKEDLSELRKCKVFTTGQEQKGFSKANPWRVLEEYPYSKKVLTKYFNQFIQDNFAWQTEFKITTSWLTKIEKGERVHYHNHVNSAWSGIFYYGDYTEKSCSLTFRNPIPNDFIVHPGPSKHNPMTKDWGIDPETNLLVFWPSNIFHYSQENLEPKTRYSLAFNFMPTSLIGYQDSSYNPSWMY